MVQLKGKDLAMFEPQSPRLPVGSTFTASIEQSKGALILHAKPDSVRLPDRELPSKPEITNKQRKKHQRRFHLDTPMNKEINGNITAKKQRNFSLDFNISDSAIETNREQKKTETQPAIKQLLSPDASIVLHQSIKSQHQKTGENKLKIDSKGEWIATVRGHNCKVSDCAPRTGKANRHQKVIFQSNLATNKIDKPLSEANAERFFKMCEGETKKDSLNSKQANRLKRKGKQEELSI